MPDIEVVRVESRRDRALFIKFPWRIYKDDPAWVPPLIIERKAFLDRKRHPFYRHGDAVQFLARKNGEVAGRIMASDDPNYNSLHQTNTGCFGMFDCIDDIEVAQALLVAAETWLRAKGRTEMMGPIDYSTNYVCGLLIDGFEHPPMLLTAHNPPYYIQLIEHHGFTKVTDWYAWWFSDFPEPLERLRRISRARAGKSGVKIRQINPKQLEADSQRIRAVYNQAWDKNWGFVPFTEAEAEHMAKEMKPLLAPDMTLIAEIGDEPVGFVMGVPDLNTALRHINGRLTWLGLPIGLLKLLYYYKKTRIARLIALGVKRDRRRHGIAELLVLHFMDASFRRGLVGELSMTLEDNAMINRFIEALGATRYKTYRIYSKHLG